YVEKLIENPKHIEIQVIGDQSGNVVHLYDRDCSVQRRHQKVVEVAPSVSHTENVHEKICQLTISLMKKSSYVDADTVEILDKDDKYYFIEVKPSIQVENTISEMVTNNDIVKTQIKVVAGHGLHDESVSITKQDQIKTHGYAI